MRYGIRIWASPTSELCRALRTNYCLSLTLVTGPILLSHPLYAIKLSVTGVSLWFSVGIFVSSMKKNWHKRTLPKYSLDEEYNLIILQISTTS